MSVVPIKISGQADLTGATRQVNNLYTSVSRLGVAFDESMKAARKDGFNTAKKQHTAWQQTIEKSRYEMVKLTEAMGDYSVASMKVPRMTDSLVDDIQKSRFGLSDMIKKRQQLNELYKRQVAYQNSIGVQYGHSAAGSSQVDAYVPNGVSSLSKTLDERRRKMAFYGQVMDSVSTKTLNWGKNTQWAGRQLMAGITFPMALAAAGTVKYAYDMDKALTQIVKVYGDTGDEMKETDESIRNSATQTAKFLARTYGQSFEDSLEIQSQLASTGVTGPTLQKDTIAVTRAKILGELDIQDAMKATISLQQVYGYENEKLAETFAYMNTMENQTSLTMQDFVVGLPKVSGIMKTLNADVKDTGVLFAAMKTAGIDAKEGGNAIKSIVFKDLAPSAQAAKTFTEMTGESLENLKNRTGGEVIPMLQAVGEAMDGLASPDRVKIMAQVFGIHQGSKALGLIDAITAASKPGSNSQVAQAMKIAKMSDEEHMEIASGELRKIANSDWNKAQRGIQATRIAIAELGEVILGAAGPMLQKFGGWLEGVADAFNNASPIVQKFILAVLGATAIAGPLVMITGLFANLGSRLMSLGKILLNTAGSGMTLMTEKQNAMRLASDNTTASINNQNAALQRQLAIMSTSNNTTVRTMNPVGTANRGSGVNGYAGGNVNVTAPSTVQAAGAIKNGGTNSFEQIKTASASASRDWGSIAQNATIAAGTAGAFGLMATESSSLLNNMSLALMLGSVAGPSIVRGLKASAPAIKSTIAKIVSQGVAASSLAAAAVSSRARVAGNLIGATQIASQSKVANQAKNMGAALKKAPSMAAAGFKTLGASILAMAGPIGIVTVAAGGLLYFINKRAKEAKAAQDALNKSVSDYASVLDIALGYEQKFETGSEDNKTESYIALADNARAANDDLDRGLKEFKEEMEGMSDERQAEEIKRYAMRKGMQARVAGATAEEAKEIARVAAVSVNKEFAEQMVFEINVDAFVDVKKVTTDQIDGARRAILGALNTGTEEYVSKASGDSGYGSPFSDVSGLGEDQKFARLNEEARESLKQSARDSWDAFSTLEGNEAKHAWQKIANDSYAGMQEFYDNLTSSQKEMLQQNKGVVSGRSFAKFIQNEGGWQEAQAYMAKEGQALTQEQNKSIQTNYEALQTLLIEYATKSGTGVEEAKEKLAGILDINALLQFDNIKANGATKMRASIDEVRQAQKNYEIQLAASAAAGKELSGAQKFLMQNEQLQALGLPRLSYLTDDWTDALKRNASANKDAAAAAKWQPKKQGSVNGQGWDDSGIYTFTDQDFTSKQMTEGMKTAYTGMRDEINEFAISAMDDAYEARMNQIEKDQEAASNAIDRDAEAGEKSMQKRMDAADALYDKREQWFNSRWDRNMERFNKKWDATMERFDKSAEVAREAVEKQYDSRIKKIDDAIKAEQDAEAQRQKIFEKEKARIEQYAKLANMAIDINMAISSGNLDEAAKLSNDAQASIESFEAGDASEDSQSASDKKVEGLEKNRTTAEKQKDRALKALEEKQEAERKDLENQRKNAEKALEIQKDQERKALEAQRKATRARLEREKEIFNKEIKARRDAGQKSYERKKTDEDKMYKLAKKRLEKEIDLLSAWAPRSEKDLKKHMGNIEKAYGEYGGSLKKKGSEWSDIVGRGLTWHVKKSQNAMANDIAWERMGNRIASRISEGAFGMSIGKFMNWVGAGGKPMAGSKAAALKGNTPITRRADGSVADDLSPISGRARHAGGVIDDSKGSRVGYSGKTQAQSEVWINALKGESVLNRKATARLGKSGVDALNNGQTHDGSDRVHQTGDGPGFGGLAQLLTAGFMKPAIEKAVLEKGATQQAKDAAAQMSAMSGGTMSRFDAFWKALAQQESGGNYKVVNSSSGALGKYQVMPANVGPWSRQVLGRTVSTSAFLNTPSLQDKIVRGILGGYYKKWGARGAAAAWYAGPGNYDLHMSTRPQPGGPSIKGYVDSIVKRMKGYLAENAPAGAGGGKAGNVWKGMGYKRMWDIVHDQFPNRAYPELNQLYGGRHSSGSYHYRKRAVDFGSAKDTVPLRKLFDFIYWNFRTKTSELIYGPMANRNIYNGQHHNYGPQTNSAHMHHVHWAMKNGGVVPGRGAGDRTPIMGEPGEFMMKKKAVENLGLPAMQMLNSDRFINMPKATVKRPVGNSSIDSGANYEYNTKVHIDARGNDNAVDIARKVEEVLDKRENRRGPSRKVGERRR